MDVTVVIPTFNRARSLARSVNSVVYQTVQPKQIVVVDDGSTDDTDGVLASLSTRHANLTTLQQANLGANAARNLGAESANTEWIAFHDSDDVWLPHKLEAVASAIDASRRVCGESPPVVTSRFVRILEPSKRARLLPYGFPSGDDEGVGFRRIDDVLNATPLLVKNFLSTQTLVVKRTTLERVGGFDPSFARFQDWDLAIRLADQAPFLVIDEPLVVAFDSVGAISRDRRRGVEARKSLLRKYATLYRNSPRSWAQAWLDMKVREFACRIA